MKHVLQFTMGYLGYFLLGFMALRSLLIQDDNVGFATSIVGLLLLVNYIAFLEKNHGTPKYSGYIKLILIVVFFASGFTLLK